MLLVKKGRFFHYLFSVKTSLEIVITDFVDKKETFMTIKTERFNFFKVSKISFFQKRLTHALSQRMQFFSFFVFGQHETRNKV